MLMTDADREIVALISEADDSGVQVSLLYDCYERGIAAGLERAAVICENRTCGSPYPLHLEGQVAACKACAAAIRAIK